MRSGDIHKCIQVNFIVHGKLRLTQLVGGTDAVTIHTSGEKIEIPPHTPHLYYYEEDTLMTEQWIDSERRPCAFDAWFYKPFRERIDKSKLERKPS